MPAWCIVCVVGAGTQRNYKWAERYPTDIGAGLETLELDPAGLSKEKRDFLYQDLEAWRFAEKFPKSKMRQLHWAQLEERQRVVRGLIERIYVARGEGNGEINRSRIIKPVPVLGIPLDSESLASSHQSLAYIERKDSHYLTAVAD